MKEKAIDRRMISATVDIDVCKKVEKKFRFSEEESMAIAYSRAFEEATRDVILTKADYLEIAQEIEANREKRQAVRNKKKR